MDHNSRTFVFVVTSLRDYGDGEVYFGADSLFTTFEQAEASIREDMRATLDNYESAYDDLSSENVDFEQDTFGEWSLRFDDHIFRWRVDTLGIDPSGIGYYTMDSAE